MEINEEDIVDQVGVGEASKADKVSVEAGANRVVMASRVSVGNKPEL